MHRSPKDRLLERLPPWWALILIIVMGTAIGESYRYNLREKEAERSNCLQRGGPLQTGHGTLRQAGQELFVVNERWRRFAAVCGGKRRQECLKRYPANAALEQSIGTQVSVTFCEVSMVGFTVAGQTFGVSPVRPATESSQ